MRRDRGAASVEFVWVTLLLLVPLVYIVLAAFDTQRAAYAVSVASKSAARAYLQSPDEATAQERARQAARVALSDQDVKAEVTVRCLPTPADCLQPGSSVQVRVGTTQPLPLTPSVLGDRIGGISVDSVHSEPFGTFREGR